MDGRWQPVSRDSKRQVKIVLHPTAAIYEVRRGLDPGSDDAIDLSEFVKDASHSAFEASVTLAFNRELFGTYQPKPNQVLEIQLFQNEWKSVWLGHIDSINSFTMQRGERQMQLVAKTRDQQDIWRNTPRVTPLYPMLTNLSYMAQRIARMTDMKSDEIVLPPSAFTTAHSNSQMADMTAWDMISAIFVALGWTPFIDGQGRLRAANRGLQGRSSDIVLTDDRMIKVGGQRQRPPINRVKVMWLDPTLRKWERQSQKVGDIRVTMGWWQIWHSEEVKFSSDETLRVEGTTLKKIHSVNYFLDKVFCKESWTQQSPTKGKFYIDNKISAALILSLMGFMVAKQASRVDWVGGRVPVIGPTLLNDAPGFGVPNPSYGFLEVVGTPAAGTLHTVPTLWTGSISESLLSVTLFAAMMNIGTGIYEIWGKPYDWVHAKNVSEAFDSSVPTWVNNVQEIECDLIGNEEHGKAVAIRELIYSAQSANKWSVTIVDDPRIEYGDLLQFPDGSQLFVEDFNRALGRGSEATLDVKGFLVGGVRGKGKPVSVVGGLPDIGVGAPGGPGGGPGGEDPNTPDPGDGSPGSSSANPIVAMSMSTIAADVQASLNWYIANMGGASNNDPNYWIDKASTPEKFSNLKWYAGWNKYWEDRMRPGNNGSADPSGGDVPAVHR